MGADLPKQFIEIGGIPVLMRTMMRFHECDASIGLVLALSGDYLDYWKELCQKHDFRLPHTVVTGGRTRFHSVLSGLDAIPANSGLVAVHDAARPFVTEDVISRCYQEASLSGAAVPVVPLQDSVRRIDGGNSQAVDRSAYRLVQTPQVFDLELLRRAYAQPYDDLFTDDASVVERLGHSVSLVEGDQRNIKLTTPYDLKVASCLI